MSEDIEKSEEKIELTQRSDELQDVLSYIPHWVVRWGITVVFGGLVSIIFASWIIRYPEVVHSRITLASNFPASKLTTQGSGAIFLMVADKETVKKGDYIASIQSPTHTRDVRTLRGLLDQFKPLLFTEDQWGSVTFPKDLELAQLQTTYNQFLQKLLEYHEFTNSPLFQQKIDSHETQLNHHHELGTKLKEQQALLEKEVQSTEATYQANAKLYEKQIISKSQLASIENNFLQHKRALVEEEKKIIQNQIQLDSISSAILELTKEHEEKSRVYRKLVRDAYNLLVSELSLWEQRYILIAPIDGEVSYLKVLIDNHYVNIGEELIAVVPLDKDRAISGLLQLTEQGAGKIGVGSTVRIRLDSYPYRDYGTLEGKIESISSVASGNTYFAHVALPQEMTTSYGKELVFRDGMQGDADIIAYDLRLIFRIANYLRIFIDP